MSPVLLGLLLQLALVKIAFQKHVVKKDLAGRVYSCRIGHVQDIESVHLDSVSSDWHIVDPIERNHQSVVLQFKRARSYHFVYFILVSNICICINLDVWKLLPDPLQCRRFDVITVRMCNQQGIYFLKFFFHLVKRQSAIEHDVLDSDCVPTGSCSDNAIIKFFRYNIPP